jgi:hypothetical protein
MIYDCWAKINKKQWHKALIRKQKIKTNASILYFLSLVTYFVGNFSESKTKAGFLFTYSEKRDKINWFNKIAS